MKRIENLVHIEDVLTEACRLGKTAAHAGATEVEQEKHLVALMHEAAANLGFDPAQIRHIGGHSFPDVVIDGVGIGVEIKCASNHRMFNGNSVWGSTAIKNLSRIYLMYWIRDEMKFGYKNYFECVTDVVATHYPRFRLYLDATDKDCVFGTGSEKIGTEQDIIFGADGFQSEKILQWMRDKAMASGKTPWWIPLNNSSPIGSAGIRSLTDLRADDPELACEILKKCYLMFPEIICDLDPNKYRNLFAWAIGRYGVMLSRDDFSSGGQVEIILIDLVGGRVQVPAVICKAKKALEYQSALSLSEIIEDLVVLNSRSGLLKNTCDWNTFLLENRARLKRGLFLDKTYEKWSSENDQVKASRTAFIDAVIDYMLENFENAILKSTPNQ